MAEPDLHVVTGAFSYTGQYLTRRLLAKGVRVMTLTGHPERPNPFGDQVRAVPFNFDKPDALAESLRGATTLYNTFWVRFSHGKATYEWAVENTEILIDAAVRAGVRRMVHVSITNPTEDSPLPYFSGKARLERTLRESGLSYAIIRPTVLFGVEDILINNIAWCLRNVPLFVVPGSGEYRMQPIYVDDMAGLMVEAAEREDNMLIDAVGPEVFTFNELLRLIAGQLGTPCRLVHLPRGLALLAARFIGLFVRDVVLTRDEADGLAADLLISHNPPTASTRFSEWLAEHAERLGAQYASELDRHYR